jgi:hypothetical protein
VLSCTHTRTRTHTYTYTHVLPSDSDTDQIHHTISSLTLSQVGFGIQKVRAGGQGRQEGIVGETCQLIDPFCHVGSIVPPPRMRNSGS